MEVLRVRGCGLGKLGSEAMARVCGGGSVCGVLDVEENGFEAGDGEAWVAACGSGRVRPRVVRVVRGNGLSVSAAAAMLEAVGGERVREGDADVALVRSLRMFVGV